MPKQPPAGPIVLSVNCIADGRFIPAGDETPFTETTLPEHLREHIATGDETFYSPASRNLYGDAQQPETRYNFQSTTGLRGGAAQIAQDWQVGDDAAEFANEPLPAETQAELEDQHDKRISLLKAQAAHNQKLTDAAYEAAVEEAEAKTTQFYVRRGGEWAKAERARLKPAETVFTKQPNGEMWVAGIVDSECQLPPTEITP